MRLFPERRNCWSIAFASSLALLISALAACGGNGRSGKPNIVLIITDDQRWDTLWAMPNVRRDLMSQGVTFGNAFVTTPLCCPSRASVLTGEYAHSTGIWNNKGRFGGFDHFRDRSTVATWLHAAGYRTALIGKYLNRYHGAYVPPGWDRWIAFADIQDPYDLYYNYLLNVDGKVKRVKKTYSTDLLAQESVRFVLQSKGPFFLYFAPYAPHWPSTPGPGDKKAFASLPPHRPPSYDEQDVSDKPMWVRRLHRVHAWRAKQIRIRGDRTYRSLLAVDRAVHAIVEALRETGRLQNTMIVFMSDNGMVLGEHRWFNKIAPYEESIRVPFVVRYDDVIARPRRNPNLVVNVDVAPTIAGAAGVGAPGAQGRSILPLLTSDRPRWRSSFLIESAPILNVPGYCGIRSKRFAYVRYQTKEEELYNIRRDPFELTNLAGDSRQAAHLKRLRAHVAKLCIPRPPLHRGT